MVYIENMEYIRKKYEKEIYKKIFYMHQKPIR